MGMNGAPLPPQHGFPLRLVVPDWYGMTSVKWLDAITISAEPFTGYQQSRGYRLRQTPDEPGEPVTRMVPRALMIPPGVPDFATRDRISSPGPARSAAARGQGWARSWASRSAPTAAVRGAPRGSARASRCAWRGWEWDWDAAPATTSSAAGPPTTPATPSRSSRRGTSAATRTTSRTGSRCGWGESRRALTYQRA